MQLRELQSKHVVIYGDNSHAHKYISIWMLLALQSNIGQERSRSECLIAKDIGVLLGCYQLTSMLTSVVDGELIEDELSAFSSKHSPGVNFVTSYVLSERISPPNALSFGLVDLLSNFHRGSWFNATAPLDGLIFSTRITAELSYAFISDLITPYLLVRDVHSPPFALFFHRLQDNEKYMLSFSSNSTRRIRGRRSLRATNRVSFKNNLSRPRSLSDEGESAQFYGEKNLDAIVEHENAMLGWLTLAKETYSVDNHIFGSNGLRVLYDVRKEKIQVSAENFCHDEEKIRSIDFVYSSLLASPRVTLVCWLITLQIAISFCTVFASLFGSSNSNYLPCARYYNCIVIALCTFTYSTFLLYVCTYIILLRQITPCGRPQLLTEVLNSLRFSFIQEWIIVHDHRKFNESVAVFEGKHPKIREVFTPNSGNYGNPERDYGLSLVPPERKGFVYFLDDDNYVHVNLWTLM